MIPCMNCQSVSSYEAPAVRLVQMNLEENIAVSDPNLIFPFEEWQDW